jgi:hypothetical protein
MYKTLAWTSACALLLACSDTTDEPGGTPYAGPDSGAPSAGHVDRSGLSHVGTDSALDYANPALWLCRPDMDDNECHRNLDATAVHTDGTLEVVKHERAEAPAFDCFYVYPTVTLGQGAQMTDFSEAGVTTTLDALLLQAARFNRICEVYAPLYRQVGLVGISPPAGANVQQSLQDVRDAFAYYLEHFNHGRNFVLMGHSQGSFVLEGLIRRDVDEQPALRARMISALLIGGQTYVPPGKIVGGSFQNIPACTQPAETGCVVAYNSFAAEAPPTASALLGRVGTALATDPVDINGQVLCVNPADLAGNTGRYAGAYFPLTIYNPSFGAAETYPAGITTPFALYRDILRGGCATAAGASYLKITAEQPAGDQRALPAYRNALAESVGFGLHFMDYNIPFEDLIETVSRQAAAMP